MDLKEELQLKEDRDYYKSKCSSLETGYLSLQRENRQLKSKIKELETRDINHEGFTVKELCSYLLDLIDEGHGDKHVELSVNYNNCDHIQGLKRVHRNDGFNWITLDGVDGY